MDLSNYLNGASLKDFFELNLKSVEIIHLLERFDLDVIYRFDRFHEGTPDSYSASAHGEGFEFQFDDEQVLETIWCYIRERDGFSQIESDAIGTFVPSSFQAAKSHAIASGWTFSEPAEACAKTWLRLEEPGLWTHYEFVDGALSLITLMRPWS